MYHAVGYLIVLARSFKILLGSFLLFSELTSFSSLLLRPVVEEFYSSPGPLVEKVVWSQPIPASFLRIAKARYGSEKCGDAISELTGSVLHSGFSSGSGPGFGSNIEYKSQNSKKIEMTALFPRKLTKKARFFTFFEKS